ncbi:MAG: flippase [Clostridia bacterium]|nr:flippase [Clostridia bacterium]
MNLKKLLGSLKKNEFLSSSVLFIFASFLLKGISFLTTPIFTRLMGSADYGAVSNFLTYANILTTFFFLQVSSGLLAAKVNHAPERFDSYVKNVTLFALLPAVVFSILLFLFRAPVSGVIRVREDLVPLIFVMAFGLSMNNLLSSYFIANGQPKQKVAYSIVSSLGIVFIGLLFVFFFSDKSAGRIVGYAVSYALVALFGYCLILRPKGVDKKNFRGDIKYALGFGLPLIPHLLANLVNGSADKIFIVSICGESANGIYTIAYNIGQLALVFASACADAWNPWYFKETKALDTAEDQREGTRRIARYFTLYAMTIGMCFVGVMLLAPEIMKLMAPQEYWSGTACILYVALGVFFLFLYRFPLGYEQLRSNTKLVAPATILAALVNVGLNAFLIPRYGIDGAAIATTVSYVVLFLFHEFVARRIVKGYNVRPRTYLLPTVTVLAGFGVAQLFLDHFVIRLVLLGLFCLFYLFYCLSAVKGNKNTSKGE